MVLQAHQYICEPGQRVNVVELGGLALGVDGGGAPAAFVGAGEGSQLRRPTAMPRRPRSAALLLRQRRPSSTRRSRASQQFRL